MKAVLVFDNVNDLVYYNWDETFLQRVKNFGNPEEAQEAGITDSDNVAQLLSPIITSQRVMAAQFGNTYTSMNCKDGTVIAFDEWLDHVFMIISEDDTDEVQRELMDCKTLVQHICGQNINLLHSKTYQSWLSILLESRTKGDRIPGASGLIGESGATAAALQALKVASKEIKSQHQHYHLMLYVGDKLLALYSSRGSDDLTAPDIILIGLQAIAAQEFWCNNDTSDDNKTSNDKTDADNSHLPWLSQENSAMVFCCAGNTASPCVPHSMHLASIAPRVVVAVLVDTDLRDIGMTAHLSSQILCNLRRLLLQRNLELLPTTLDALESSVKKTTDALKKHKTHTSLCARLSSRMLELRKSCTTTTPLTPETTATAMHTALDAVIEILRPDIPSINMEPALKELKNALLPYVEFLRVKAMRFFGLGPAGRDDSLTLNKYVEEFPGLVHFVYIDRGAARFLAPDMADCRDVLTHQMWRGIMSRWLSLIREGYSGATWRAGPVHVCGVAWWHGRVAATLHRATVRALPTPGDIRSLFHRQLAELSFPGETNVRGIELICVHLGLLPSAAAVAQARRLAHAVHDDIVAPQHHLL